MGGLTESGSQFRQLPLPQQHHPTTQMAPMWSPKRTFDMGRAPVGKMAVSATAVSGLGSKEIKRPGFFAGLFQREVDQQQPIKAAARRPEPTTCIFKAKMDSLKPSRSHHPLRAIHVHNGDHPRVGRGV
ncbi:hypothetical protein BASA81_009633 [Batrachochytrium salamandrivorans]|nr:hypothetical protein BASA81_009633 [Batrachochytrium salamandrivorans]